MIYILRDYIFEVCFFMLLLCGSTEEACSMVNSLRKVDFSHPTGHYTWEKIACRPCRRVPMKGYIGGPLGGREGVSSCCVPFLVKSCRQAVALGSESHSCQPSVHCAERLHNFATSGRTLWTVDSAASSDVGARHSRP